MRTLSPPTGVADYLQHFPALRKFSAAVAEALTPSPTENAGVVELLSDSFDYRSSVIPALSNEQIPQPHDSSDSRVPGREVAHHCEQPEIYLHDKRIAPPQYRF